jgi:hypothetical protein
MNAYLYAIAHYTDCTAANYNCVTCIQHAFSLVILYSLVYSIDTVQQSLLWVRLLSAQKFVL